ncbi:hypothetical protein BDQ94DRAFT_142265 [Aspergillus welwitschiae]|uniref:Uncharacterized protein n=1 Tax=Aspergillus welwitschiae TaxID=1341132 RepID=A0A3F3Q4P1_9EURO|nr:hypothetical protein BDQ94DRAFT_142265 [Aspergillus welwitschiae]RDH34194.1 hypothetical protein BDQ94DRAFT_142265 [Aspergillus welwitschiae]
MMRALLLVAKADQVYELLEPYWRRWLTLGRPSILFCIRALCECGRQRDRTSCQ